MATNENNSKNDFGLFVLIVLLTAWNVFWWYNTITDIIIGTPFNFFVKTLMTLFCLALWSIFPLLVYGLAQAKRSSKAREAHDAIVAEKEHEQRVALQEKEKFLQLAREGKLDYIIERVSNIYKENPNMNEFGTTNLIHVEFSKNIITYHVYEHYGKVRNSGAVCSLPAGLKASNQYSQGYFMQIISSRLKRREDEHFEIDHDSIQWICYYPDVYNYCIDCKFYSGYKCTITDEHQDAYCRRCHGYDGGFVRKA